MGRSRELSAFKQDNLNLNFNTNFNTNFNIAGAVPRDGQECRPHTGSSRALPLEAFRGLSILPVFIDAALFPIHSC